MAAIYGDMDLESNTDSTRKLASIQVVDRIHPHTGADSLELATILGWQIITRIGEVQKGDTVIYCEIDSLLPVNVDWLPQAVKDRIVKEGTKDYFRVKTIKLRGELSQGLIIPLGDTLPPIGPIVVGNDVTDLLKIRKYEPPIFSYEMGNHPRRSDGTYVPFTSSRPSGNFPSHLVKKTDETRIQSNPKLLELLKDKPYYIAVKLDGTSATYLLNPDTGELMVCSRNMIRKRPDDINTCPYWLMAVKYDLENKLKDMPHLAIQGEICGPTIQKNLLGLKNYEFFVFNIVDTRDRQIMALPDMIAFCSEMRLSMVPIEESGTSYPHYFPCDIKGLLTRAQGTYPGTKNAREGLVVRAADQSISFKVINNDYLLKHGY